MKKTLLVVFLLMLWSSAYKVSADTNGYIVKLTPDTLITASRFEKIFKNTYYTKDINNIYGLEGVIEYIEPDDEVELIMPIENKKKNRQLKLNESSETINWQSEMIKADFAWDLATYGNGINIAVIDSGRNRHIDIVDSLAGGHNYILSIRLEK